MGTLRIIAGTLRGRRIRVPRGEVVRPTPDRVREALFSILGPRVEGRSVLDAYAGSGALGLEAISRGAQRVTFVEADRRALEALRRNLADLGVEERCRVVAGRVEDSLTPTGLSGRFDLVLADPPYPSYPGSSLLLRVRRSGLLAPGGMIVVQRDRRAAPADPVTAGFRLERTTRYGRTCLDFFVEEPSGESR